MDDHINVTSVFHQVLFGKILGEGVGVWELANQFLLLLSYFLQAHGHDLRYEFLLIQILVIDLLLNETLSVAVHVSG